MAVARMWGRVGGTDVAPFLSNGDEWFFPIPPGSVGDVIAEFWAEDDVGNIGYRSAILTVGRAGVKCIRWIMHGGECTMLAIRRPISEVLDRGRCECMCAVSPRPLCEDITVRAECTMLAIACRRAEA